MVRRTAQFITYGSDEQCSELIKSLEESGVRLDVRDIEKMPLSESEIRKIVGYCNIHHFLNPLSKTYEKHDLSKKDKSRDEIIALMLTDHTLIRRPMVRTSRLVTIGCDKKVIESVLQLNAEQNPITDAGNRAHGIRPNHAARPSSGRSNQPRSSSKSSRSSRPSRGGRGSHSGRPATSNK